MFAAVLFCGGIGILNLIFFFRNPTRPLFALLLGLVLSWIALNYLPLLLYSIDIIRQENANYPPILLSSNAPRACNDAF